MKLYFFIIFFFVMLGQIAFADSEPTALEVQQAAIGYRRLNADEVRHWQGAARHSPWLPRLQIGFDRNLDTKIALSVDDNTSVTSKGVVVGPAISKSDANSQNQDSYNVRAIWSLDELIYNHNQVVLNEEMRSLMREVEHVAREVNRIYHDRLEAKRRLSSLEVARLDGELDAMTGGWFTEACQRRGR